MCYSKFEKTKGDKRNIEALSVREAPSESLGSHCSIIFFSELEMRGQTPRTIYEEMA